MTGHLLEFLEVFRKVVLDAHSHLRVSRKWRTGVLWRPFWVRRETRRLGQPLSPFRSQFAAAAAAAAVV